MKVLLNVSIARFSNNSFKVFSSGEVVDLPADEGQRMIDLGRATKVEETVEPQVEVKPTIKKSSPKRGA